MRKAGVWTIAAVLVLTIGLTGCGKKVKQGSPKDLLESAHAAFVDRDAENAVKCVEPDYQEAASVMFGAAMDLMKAYDSAVAAVESKLGKDAADKMRGDSIPSPLQRALKDDGSIDWDKIKIEEKDDSATYTIDGRSEKLKRIDGKWYMDAKDEFGDSPEEAMKKADEAKEMAPKIVEALGKFEKSVKAGDVTADNFDVKFAEAMR